MGSKEANKSFQQSERIFSFLTMSGYRAEDFLMEKIDKKRPTRPSNLECLGQGMIDAGNEFGGSQAYGKC